jgi:vitamin B12 transporter
MHSVYNSNFVLMWIHLILFLKFHWNCWHLIARLITPSLSIVFSLWNLNLTPEESATVEAGFEVSLLDKKLTFNTITFWEEQNPFGFYESDTYASNYVNIVGRNNAKGVETMVAYSFRVRWRLMQIIHLLKWKSL